ncbi:MAG: hypothetical protein AB7O62_22085 [Pirellulales bacterium]
MKTLVIDIGGTNVKVWSADQEDAVKIESGRKLTPADLVEEMAEILAANDFEVISIGYPGTITDGRPSRNPFNLGEGWVEFDYAKKFPKPIRWMNDAAMQALGSYRGGRMLFLGLGTSVGSTLIVDRLVVPLELGNLFHPFGETLEDHLAKQALEDDGTKRWRKAAVEVLERMRDGFMADEVVLGGGNAKKLKLDLPSWVRLGHNRNAYRGGCRLWECQAQTNSHLFTGDYRSSEPPMALAADGPGTANH